MNDTTTTEPSECLQALLRAYREALRVADSASGLTLSPDDAVALDLGRKSRTSTWRWRSWRGRPILRYLLHRHIDHHVSSLRRAYARHAVFAAEAAALDRDRAVLAAMAEWLPSRISPRRLWIMGVALFLGTVRLWIHPEALSERDWKSFDGVRQAIQTVGAGNTDELLDLVQNSSLDLWLVLGYVVASFYFLPVFLILRKPFEVKRVLLSVDPDLVSEGELIPSYAKTAYELERRVFSLLDERTPREMQIDLCVPLAIAAAWVLFWTSGFLVFARSYASERDGADVLVFLFILPFVVAPAGQLLARVRQRWRARSQGELALLPPFSCDLRRAPFPRLCVRVGFGVLFANWLARGMIARDWWTAGFGAGGVAVLAIRVIRPRLTRGQRESTKSDAKFPP